MSIQNDDKVTEATCGTFQFIPKPFTTNELVQVTIIECVHKIKNIYIISKNLWILKSTNSTNYEIIINSLTKNFLKLLSL